MNEIDLIEKIRKLATKGPQIAVGIGDDCAVFRPKPKQDLLFKTDPMIEDIHFTRDLAPEIVGHRALARNLSDLAAMGGDPEFCLVSLALPAHLMNNKLGEKWDEEWIGKFYRGLMALAKKTGTALAGGHLAKADKLFCDVIVCGSVPRGKALLRSGAKPPRISETLTTHGLNRWDLMKVPASAPITAAGMNAIRMPMTNRRSFALVKKPSASCQRRLK